MSARHLVESTVTLVRDHLKANMATALSDVRTDRADHEVNTEPPSTESYFIYEPAAAYKAPAVFIIAEEQNFLKNETKANHINSVVKLNVAAVIEDREKNRITVKSWRYQAALHELLDQTRLTSADNAVTLVVVVTRAAFSPLYTNAKNKGDPQAFFRKEVLLECEVSHYENF